MWLIYATLTVMTIMSAIFTVQGVQKTVRKIKHKRKW